MGDVAQQLLLAQQSRLHIFSLATFERMHDCAATGIAATGSIIASKIAMGHLLNTAHLLAHGAPAVEPGD